jgi:AcrR family transcriptional regulator
MTMESVSISTGTISTDPVSQATALTGPPSGHRATNGRGVGRSLEAARQRAERQMQRFLDAAWEIMPEHPDGDFTVQEVVDRARASLRSFYHYFSGKQELMFVLLEDVMARTSQEMLRRAAEHTEPLSRLQAAVLELHRSHIPDPTCPRTTLANFGQHIQLSEPAMAATMQRPVVTVLTGLIEAAAKSGTVSSEDPQRAALIILHVIGGMSLQSAIPAEFGQRPYLPEEIWAMCQAGVLGGARR